MFEPNLAAWKAFVHITLQNIGCSVILKPVLGQLLFLAWIKYANDSVLGTYAKDITAMENSFAKNPWQVRQH